MFSLQEYAKKWNRATDKNFAVACYDQNSLKELEEAAASPVDPTDMEAWHIDNPQEWHDAIAAALWERVQPRVDTINEIIASLGLADNYGESGGLLAEYEPAAGLIVRDEVYSHTFSPDVSDETISAYLQKFVDDKEA